ncbi:3',5'-cyclic adenosine monophosphate phosphodiesterase CpdA [compost metagenome]
MNNLFKIEKRGKFRVLIIGDLHLSDVFRGRHVDYLGNCLEVLGMITKTIEQNEITHLILTGDLIGVNEKNFKYRDTLLALMKILQHWNKLTNNNVYSVRGNHDSAAKLTDFDVCLSLDLIKNVAYFDAGWSRYHLINYGEEGRKLDIDDDKHNVAVVHNNIQVEGETNWFVGGKSEITLSSMDNWYGVDFVVAGHIHNPSVKVVTTSIRDWSVSLFYPGSPTRPIHDKRVWEQCYGLVFISDDITDDYSVELDQVVYKLKPASELYHEVIDDMVLLDDEQETTYSIEELSKILAELEEYNLLGMEGYKSQLKRLAGLDSLAAEKAIEYIEMVENES